MRTLTLKLASALFVVALFSACSSTKTASTGSESDASSNVSTSGVQSGGVNNTTAAMNASGKLLSSGNIIYFDYDSDVIRPDGRNVLMTHAARLKGGKNATLEGHADERGSREYNIALGERRAKAVRDFLVIQGVSSTQLEVVSYGEERPVDSASNETAWAKNRRVEIK